MDLRWICESDSTKRWCAGEVRDAWRRLETNLEHFQIITKTWRQPRLGPVLPARATFAALRLYRAAA
jgi:hypothetical protein